jgi:AcrR family transcriptional regulator
MTQTQKRTRNPNDKIERILTAAKKILSNGGYMTRFSLSAVAAEAGVSKGGLLHHFPDKETLVRGLSENLINSFEARLVVEMEKESIGTPGRFARAYIATAFSDEYGGSQVSPILLAFNRYSADGAPVESRFRAFQTRLENDGLDPVSANLIRMTVDGMLYTEMIDAESIDSDLRASMINDLIQMTHPSQ